MILAETSFDIGQNFKKIRFKSELSQAEMSEILDVPLNKYKFIETGVTQIRAMDLIDFANKLGINPVDILFKDFEF